MSIDLATLRSNRNTNFASISAQFEKETNPQSYEDNRFWKPERDKAGNAQATGRFLASAVPGALPWVKLFSHAFKFRGRWYIENCPTTIGKPCPACELNVSLWNSSEDKNSPERKQASVQKRKLNYISNFLLRDDKKHPENNGLVKLYKYGKKIFDKIVAKGQPVFEDEEPCNVFDLWEGADFKLRMKMKDGFPNYDDSVFEASTPVADTDEAILEIVNAQYDLKEFEAEANFKSYEDLAKRLELVMNGPATANAASDAQDGPAVAPAPPVGPSKPAKAPKAAAPKSKLPAVEDDADDDVARFERMAMED